MYRNSQTGQALRDISSLIGNMPLKNAQSRLATEQAKTANLQGLTGLREAEMRQPALMRDSQKAQAELDIMNRPVHVSQLVGNVEDPALHEAGFAIKNTPGQAIMMTQDQKYKIDGVGKVPTAYEQLQQNIAKYNKWKFDADGNLVDQNGQYVPNYKAAPAFDEARRIKKLNMDPMVAVEERKAMVQDAINSGQLSPQQLKGAEAELAQLNSADEITIREKYLAELQRLDALDRQSGRPAILNAAMINEQINKINALRTAASEQSKREFELEKIGIEHQNRLGEIGAQGANAFKLAGMKGSGGSKMDQFSKARLATISNSIGEIDKIIANGTMEDEYGGKVPLDKASSDRLLAQREALYQEAYKIQSGENIQTAQPEQQQTVQPPTITPEEAMAELQRRRSGSGSQAKQPKYGNRNDGTQKGSGYFGELKRPDGNISTELSIGVNIGGNETEIPALVPTLSQKEIDFLLAGNRPTKEIVQKAVDHAKQRMSQGLSPFAEEGEQVKTPPQKETDRFGRQKDWYSNVNWSNVGLSEDGAIYGVDESGRTRQIMAKPPEKIYNGKYDNPEYAQYLSLLQQYGITN